MKLAWKALVVLGIVLVVIAFSLETTVSTGSGRVHNIGLQAQQQMLLILGCFVFIAGIGLFGVVKLKQTPDEDAEDRAAKAKAEQRARDAIATADRMGDRVSAGTNALWTTWLKVWGMVRRPYVLAVGVVVLGFTVLFPQHLGVFWTDGGVKIEYSQPLFIGTAKEPLLVGELISSLFWRTLVIGLLYWKARK